MRKWFELLFDTLPKLPLSIAGTRVVLTWVVLYCVIDFIGKFV